MNINPTVLHPYPSSVKWLGDYFKIPPSIKLIVSDTVCPETLKYMKRSWNSFTQTRIKLTVSYSAELPANSFQLSNKPGPFNKSAAHSAKYSKISISPRGVSASGTSETDLKHCWISILQLLVPEGTETIESWQLPLLTAEDRPTLKFRGIHLCVFPETTLEFIEKIITLAAFTKYSHIVIEFWGMLKYESLPELSWPQAYNKKQIKKLLELARQMGIKPIPMFNHLGHAAASRDRIGRHVVLDQNPRLEPLFEPDGWTWCTKNPASLKLLKNIREELLELFYDAEYFHIGCDEAYSHGTCPTCQKYDSAELLAECLNTIDEDLNSHKIRPFIWGDSLLEKAKWTGYIASSSTEQNTHKAINLISKNIIITDWQYGIKEKTQTETVDHFTQKGFDVITAPYNNNTNILAMADIAASKNILGMLLTTWNTLPFSMKTIPLAAGAMWNHVDRIQKMHQYQDGYLTTVLASYLRKIRTKPSPYQNAGWRSYEIDDKTNL